MSKRMVVLRNGDPLRLSRYCFTAEEASVLHDALSSRLYEVSAWSPCSARESEMRSIALLLSKIDGRLRPLPEVVS